MLSSFALNAASNTFQNKKSTSFEALSFRALETKILVFLGDGVSSAFACISENAKFIHFIHKKLIYNDPPVTNQLEGLRLLTL